MTKSELESVLERIQPKDLDKKKLISEYNRIRLMISEVKDSSFFDKGVQFQKMIGEPGFAYAIGIIEGIFLSEQLAEMKAEQSEVNALEAMLKLGDKLTGISGGDSI